MCRIRDMLTTYYIAALFNIITVIVIAALGYYYVVLNTCEVSIKCINYIFHLYYVFALVKSCACILVQSMCKISIPSLLGLLPILKHKV